MYYTDEDSDLRVFQKIDRFDMALASDADKQLIDSFVEYGHRQLQCSAVQADRFCCVVTLGLLAHLGKNEALLERPAMNQLIHTLLDALSCISKEQ